MGPIALGGIFILMQLASVIDSGNEVSYDQALVCLTNRKQPRYIVEREKKKKNNEFHKERKCIRSCPNFTMKGSEETGPCSVSVSSRGKYCNVTMSIAISISSQMLLLAEVLLNHKRILKHDWILDF